MKNNVLENSRDENNFKIESFSYEEITFFEKILPKELVKILKKMEKLLSEI